jgi:hypothetical protein
MTATHFVQRKPSAALSSSCRTDRQPPSSIRRWPPVASLSTPLDRRTHVRLVGGFRRLLVRHERFTSMMYLALVSFYFALALIALRRL